MYFRISHPVPSISTLAYSFYINSATPEVEEQVNRLGPQKIIASAFDWPHKNLDYHGWADTLNSLWWPRGGDEFSTLFLIITDAQADLLEENIAAQVAATTAFAAPRPYVVLSAILAPAEGTRPAEAYSPCGITPQMVEDAGGISLHEWKLYPLTPVRIPKTSTGDRFTGLWLLPLVDIRYYHRAVALNSLTGGTQIAASDDGDFPFPLLRVDHAESDPDWMPDLLGPPDDTTEHSHYVAISNNGTHPSVDAHTSWGTAVDVQAKMNNWRIVCRDVRSEYNDPDPDADQHTDFTGVVSDYPDDYEVESDLSLIDPTYHRNAMELGEYAGNLISGGESDSPVVQDLIARKLQFLFRISGDDTYYTIVLKADIEDPASVADFSEDTDGLGTVERTHIPKVFLGVEAGSRAPISQHRLALVAAAKQWMFLYFLWRRRQAFYKFPGIAPLVPNGHASLIKWTFSSTEFSTTYVAIEGIEGTDDGFCAVREGKWGRIDGEGAIADQLDGKYAWTEMEDTTAGGTFSVKANGVVGYVRNVGGASENANYAQDDASKRAVPVGLIVWMKPGTPYLDEETGDIFDHWRFTTPDLLQVVRLRLTGERNAYGHYGAVVRRWNPVTKEFDDSEIIWAVLLTG